MRFSLLVTAKPYEQQTAASALQFAQALFTAKHELYRVFFYGDGTLAALQSTEKNPLSKRWAKIASHTDLCVCVASAVRRGVYNELEARRHSQSALTMHPAFSTGGLGQFVDACNASDRVITFS